MVTLGATLQQIHNFDEEAGTITTVIWFGFSILIALISFYNIVFDETKRLNYEWKDPRLAWNESHANGIRDVRLRIKDIWLPDIEIYNLVSKKALRREDEVKIKLLSYLPDFFPGGFEK